MFASNQTIHSLPVLYWPNYETSSISAKEHLALFTLQTWRYLEGGATFTSLGQYGTGYTMSGCIHGTIFASNQTVHP
jgi:hypothetical protein